MTAKRTAPQIDDQPRLMMLLEWYAIIACVVSVLSVLIADFVAPDHDWMADTISDLAAGRYEFIVDIGIYALSSALVAMALLAAHVLMGDWRWSVGLVGMTLLGLIVFLIGARNEHGDNDSKSIVIHIYLVYALGGPMAVVPALMAQGAGRAAHGYARVLIGITIVWVLSARVFFFLPTDIDGI